MVGEEPRRGQRCVVRLGDLTSRADAPPPGLTRTGAAVELRRLTKRYGAETVVDGFDATLAPGEFFSLLGPSGSGKTTTLMMVAGFAGIDAGSLLVDGRDLSGVPPERRGFGMVFQNYAIFPHLDVFENVAFPLRARRLPRAAIKERVGWALDLVQLGAFGKRYARQLSGGQQQRVAIARAIVFHPSLVLMDEPLGALDKNLRFDMQTEIKEIQQRLRMTVLYVTHDQEEAMNLSDRVAIMQGGRIEQIGAPRDVYEHPGSVFVAKFLGEANLLPGTVESLTPHGATLRLPGGGALQAARPTALMAGQPGALFVRPEKMTLARAPAAGPANAVAGTVRRSSFLGNTLRYAVEVAPGLTLTADMPNRGGTFQPDTGDAVTVTWAAEDSSILPPATA